MKPFGSRTPSADPTDSEYGEMVKHQLARHLVILSILTLSAFSSLSGGNALAQSSGLSVSEYARACAEEIGPIPPFSCNAGVTAVPGDDLGTLLKSLAVRVPPSQILPISIDGRYVGEGPGEIPASEIEDDTRCDRPKVLGGGEGHCQPYSRIGRLPSVGPDGADDDDVRWTYICRRYNLQHNGTTVTPTDDLFEDVAIIGSRASSGATCFFQMLGLRSAARVPSPMETPEETPDGHLTAEEFWLPAKAANPGQSDVANIPCYECHNRDPWIHTPYVDQVCLRDAATGECKQDAAGPVPIVPRGADRRNFSGLAPYSFVAAAELGWPTQWETIDVDMDEDGNLDPAEKCTQCHRVGTNGPGRFNYCSTILENSLGRDSSFSNRYLSDTGKRIYHRVWMPPEGSVGLPPPAVGETFWEQAHSTLFPSEYLDKIVSCCRDPDQSFCVRQTLP